MSEHSTIVPAAAGATGILAPGQRGPVMLISAGVGMHAFNDLAIAASVPVAYSDLGALPMLPVAYALFFIGVVTGGLLSARLRSRFGARRLALGAATVFVTGVLLTSTAPAGAVFALGRAMQGLSDGLIVALCYGLIPELIAPALVQRVFSVEAVVWALAAALGPLAGGFATEYLDWRAAMLVCLPFAILFLICATLILPARPPRAPERRVTPSLPVQMCLAGAVLLSVPAALPALPLAALAIPVGLALFAAALHRDAGADDAFFPRAAFRTGTVGRATWALFLMPVAQSVSSVFLPLSLRETFDISPVWVGWMAVTMAMCWSLSAMWVAARPAGLRHTLMRAGPAFQVAGALTIACGFSAGLPGLVAIGHGLSGVAFGLVWGPANQAIMRATAEGEQGRTSSFMPTIQTTGFAVGAGLGGWAAGLTGLIPALQSGSGTGAVWVIWGGAAAVALAGLAATLSLPRAIRD